MNRFTLKFNLDFNFKPGGSHPLRYLALCSFFLLLGLAGCTTSTPEGTPGGTLLRTIDLWVGETERVTLSNGKSVEVSLLQVDAVADNVRGAIRRSTLELKVDGKPLTLECGNYRLPTLLNGVQIDCTITGPYRENNREWMDPWKLKKDARLRLWPKGSPLVKPGTFVYPVKQRWFASGTQMANEPCYVDGSDLPSAKSVYYHNGLDIGGSESQVEVVAATDALVVSKGDDVLAEHEENTPVDPRYDVIYLLDDRGWYYRYSHLYSIDDGVTLGERVEIGQTLGLLGKEGGSGGWSHLHFAIYSRQPSNEWGTQEGYALLWESYQNEYKPDVVAVARPHHLIWAGETVTLDGSRSRSLAGEIKSYEWTFTDGTTASGPQVERTYTRAGAYSEVLKVTDGAGRVGYDFAIVQVIEKQEHEIGPENEKVPPTLHAVYYPTTSIRPGDEVTFKVRAFRTTHGKEK